jgi:DNA-binding IclR family transcriptional regulator
VEKMDISRNLRLYAQIGMRVPAYCSSLGKCLLSSLSGDDLEYILSLSVPERYAKLVLNFLENILKKY